MVIMDP